MKTTLAIAKRQFVSYFNGPVAYIVICGALLFVGFFFWQPFFLDGRATVRNLWQWVTLSLILVAPALSMGLLADEKRTGTLELLLTLPVKDWELIVGKYLGVLGLYLVFLLLTLPYPMSVASLGDLEWGQTMAGYLGMFLLGAGFLAFGLMASSWTSSQVVALFVSVLYCFFVGFAFDKVLALLPSDYTNYLEWLSFDFHRASMARGVVDSRDVIFFLTMIVLPLLIAFRSIESRRWR
ncbi:MAG: ABC transporter permease subunit [Myxococcota bacterium]